MNVEPASENCEYKRERYGERNLVDGILGVGKLEKLFFRLVGGKQHQTYVFDEVAYVGIEVSSIIEFG